MAELIDKQKAIQKLEQIRDSRKKSCSRQAIMEAAAMNYAIEILKRMPADEIRPRD